MNKIGMFIRRFGVIIRGAMVVKGELFATIKCVGMSRKRTLELCCVGIAI